MSNFIVDPETYAQNHGYQPKVDPFRNNRFGYRLNGDLREGFTSAVRNGQTTLALEYLSLIIEVLDMDLLSSTQETTKKVEAKTSKPALKPKADGEIAE